MLNCCFISRKMSVRPSYRRAFLPPLLSTAVMAACAWAVYGLCARALHAQQGGRMMLAVPLGAAILLAVIVYVVMVVVTKSVTLEDMKLIPKGEKLAKLLHIK